MVKELCLEIQITQLYRSMKANGRMDNSRVRDTYFTKTYPLTMENFLMGRNMGKDHLDLVTKNQFTLVNLQTI